MTARKWLGAAALLAGFALIFPVTVDQNGWHSALIGWATFFGLGFTAAGLLALTWELMP